MNQYVPCPLPAISLHMFLSRKNRERVIDKKKKETERPAHHEGPT